MRLNFFPNIQCSSENCKSKFQKLIFNISYNYISLNLYTIILLFLGKPEKTLLKRYIIRYINKTNYATEIFLHTIVEL